jgi:hypothetical protein
LHKRNINDKINYERGEKMELIDIVNENNEFTGQIEEREIAYEKGLWRRTVSCWIMNEKGEILLQKDLVIKRRILTNGPKLVDK